MEHTAKIWTKIFCSRGGLKRVGASAGRTIPPAHPIHSRTLPLARHAPATPPPPRSPDLLRLQHQGLLRQLLGDAAGRLVGRRRRLGSGQRAELEVRGLAARSLRRRVEGQREPRRLRLQACASASA
ncbi:hypothetical protein SETIT_2G196100v2 [Setaria italica]|uniref:Uncharacterized protein n=2 Tax=Setaria TaxID=4554 RepID=A0A368Q0L0_SETIT|nr:hypothetical protein SETIT_2G196100v2 [Setaria italica]TKW33000.1 hypothetical protein SEVIR_2G203800v2 [Setaria viridis]